MGEIDREVRDGPTPALTYFPDELDAFIRKCERFCAAVALFSALIALVSQSLDFYLRLSPPYSGSGVLRQTGVAYMGDCSLIAADVWVVIAAGLFRRSVHYETFYIAGLNVRFAIMLIVVCLVINEYRSYLGNWTSALGTNKAHLMLISLSIQYTAHLILSASLIAAAYFLRGLRRGLR